MRGIARGRERDSSSGWSGPASLPPACRGPPRAGDPGRPPVATACQCEHTLALHVCCKRCTTTSPDRSSFGRLGRLARTPGRALETLRRLSSDMASVYRVLHVDLDQFIAAVEMLRRPELAGRPSSSAATAIRLAEASSPPPLRGPRARHPVRDAAHRGTALPGRGLPASRQCRVRNGVGRGDGRAAEASGDRWRRGRGAGVGRGVRGRHDGRRRGRRAADPGRVCTRGRG